VFRAVGWFKGKAEITAGRINCEIPNVTNAISEGAFAMGLWNTYGVPTLYYPDVNSPFGNPCGVWIQLQNNMIDQGLMLDHVDLKYRIAGARRFRRGGVSMRKQFPTVCRQLRNQRLFVGNRLNPVNSTQDTSTSGAPNVAFIEMLPFVTPEMVTCLQSVFADPTVTFTSLDLVVRATAVGVSDAGETYRSNPIQYTLDLRHTCGNGRVDDGEVCDPAATGSTCVGICNNGTCSQNNSIPCTDDSQCQGVCLAPNNPSECTCVY
jgi:hypothetical protein